MASLLLTPQRQAPNGPFLKGSRSGQKQPQAVSSLEFELRLSLRIPVAPSRSQLGWSQAGEPPIAGSSLLLQENGCGRRVLLF